MPRCVMIATLLLLSIISETVLGLSVVADDWRPRERGARGARNRPKSRGINLYGSPKTHGRPQAFACPSSSLAPCKCKPKSSGLDITCQSISLRQIEHVATVMKKEIQPTTEIGYFKIRESSLHRLPDYIFMGLSIVHLMIYNSNLETLSPNSLPHSKLKHLVLSNNELKEVPTIPLRHMRELDHLNLGQNNITVLRDGAFASLKKVTRLTLYDNKIHTIHQDAFEGLEKDLLRLNLVRNLLTDVPTEALLILKNLNQLDLSDNKIKTLQSRNGGRIFEGLDKLDTLAMDHNQLTKLSAGDFEGLPRLTSLSLDYNKISHIDNEAFRGLEGNLQYLSITHNKLNYIPAPSLRPLHQLITLHLDDNNITRLESHTFSGYGEHIKNLWLQNNHIHQIPDETFEDLHSLEWLKLWNNELEGMSYSLMEPVLDTLKHLDIHSNPLICDCEMRWYKRWYNDGWQDVDEDHIRDTACTDPSDGKEHNIAEVDLSHMFCAKAAQISRASQTSFTSAIQKIILILTVFIAMYPS